MDANDLNKTLDDAVADLEAGHDPKTVLAMTAISVQMSTLEAILAEPEEDRLQAVAYAAVATALAGLLMVSGCEQAPEAV